MRSVALLVVGWSLSAGDASVAPTWSPDPTATSDRAAILVGVGTYQQATWALPHIPRNLEAMRTALARDAVVGRDFIRVITDKEVSRDALAAALDQLVPRLRGDATLIIYWTGHGFVDASQQTVFFTSYTQQGDSGFTPVVPRSDLARLLADARGKTSEATLRATIITDVCRVKVMAPPPAAELVPGDDWELHGTSAGRFAEAPGADLAAPFTRSLVASMGALAAMNRPADLATVFADAQQRTRLASQGAQDPELIRPTGAGEVPVLVPARGVPVQIRVVDAVAGTALADATLTMGERNGIPAAGKVHLPAGEVILTVQAPGCLSTPARLTVGPEQAEQLLTLRAWPTLAVVRGSFSGAASGTPVRIEGVTDTARPDAHRLVTALDTKGGFELLIPAPQAGLAVVIGDLRFELPADPAAWSVQRWRQGLSAPLLDLGLLTAARSGQPVTVIPAAPERGTPPPPTPIARTPQEGTAPEAPTTDAPSGTVLMPRKGKKKQGSAASDGGSYDVLVVVQPPAAVPRTPDGAWDLREAGTPAGGALLRYLVGPRPGTVVDLRSAGAPAGDVPARPVVGLRQRTTVDLRSAGTVAGERPVTKAISASRAGTTPDLRSEGSAAGELPEVPDVPIPRTGTTVDLTEAGSLPGFRPAERPLPIPRNGATADLSTLGSDPDSPVIPESMQRALDQLAQQGR